MMQYISELCQANGGGITPEVILRDAERSSSPLRKYFEWDDKKAEHLYQLDQARELIASCIEE